MPRETWRLIRTDPLPGALNMAVDEALLEAVAAGRSLPVLRLYRWSPPALTLGYGQAATGVDFVSCRDLGVDVVRRSTGGRAVLHEHEVTYAVVSPDRTGVFPGGISGNYRVIAAALQGALRSFGIETRLASGRTRGGEGDANICFAAPSIHELVYQGCKMTGSAQRRSAGAFLQHGSLPVDLDLERLSRILGCGSDPQRKSEALSKKVGWLNRFLAVPVTVTRVEESLISAFTHSLGIDFEVSVLSDSEWGRARAIKGNFEF